VAIYFTAIGIVVCEGRTRSDIFLNYKSCFEKAVLCKQSQYYYLF